LSIAAPRIVTAPRDIPRNAPLPPGSRARKARRYGAARFDCLLRERRSPSSRVRVVTRIEAPRMAARLGSCYINTALEAAATGRIERAVA